MKEADVYALVRMQMCVIKFQHNVIPVSAGVCVCVRVCVHVCVFGVRSGHPHHKVINWIAYI